MSTAATTPSTEVVTPPVAPVVTLPEGVDAMEKLQDGKWHVKLATGEDFTGTDAEILGKMGTAHVSTKRWGQDFKNKWESVQNVVTPPSAPAVPDAQQQLRNWLLDETAKGLGYNSADEMKSRLATIDQTTEAVSDQRVAMEFHSNCWDFPAAPENTEKLFKVGANYGIFQVDDKGELVHRPTAKQLEAAHKLAVATGEYKPLTREEYQLAMQAGNLPKPNQATPPPVTPQGGADVNANVATDPWKMKMEDLASLIKSQQAK